MSNSTAPSHPRNLLSDIRRHSLPLLQNATEVCEIRSRPGMECMPLRSPPGPYHHYHVTDQTKSLQELQNEVGALLEFRDLVIETFPDLKHKMASMSTTNTIPGITSSLVSRREWEPGIRVKRKITQKENNEMSSSLIRSRSNSHSGKKEPKSGEGNGSVVQDSGFSTETSSSKETHSASSTTGAIQGAATTSRLVTDTDDELLNLLDIIHKKGNRLREEVEHLQNIERNKIRKIVNDSNLYGNGSLSKTFQECGDRFSRGDIQVLRKERDRLLDKLVEMEAETLAGRIKATEMQDQYEELRSVKKDLEEQLKAVLNQKLELDTKLQELYRQFTSKSSSSSQSDSTSHKHSSTATVLLTSQQFLQGVSSTNNRLLASTSNTAVTDTVTLDQTNLNNKAIHPFHNSMKQIKYDCKALGHLDGLVSSPNRINKIRVADSKKIAAILLETNVLELQRHLLTLTVQNQVLIQRLEQATKSKILLSKKLDKSKEDIDDLRFQLEEKDIELEGTKAQLRVLELKTPSKLDFNLETNRSTSTIVLSSRDSAMPLTQISTPSMKAMIPLPMDEVQQHSNNLESAVDHTEQEIRMICMETPRRRPSKIPLPGTKGYLAAPKPPTGRATQRNSGTSSKNLSRSTGNLSGPPSVRRDNTPSLNRPESAQSIQSRSSSSSIPISSKSTPSPHKVSSSPLPKPKRDSLSRVRHLDSLSRVYNSPSPNGSSNSCNSNNTSNHQLTAGSTINLHRLQSTSFSQGQSRDRKQSNITVRRVATVGRANADIQQSEPDNGKDKVSYDKIQKEANNNTKSTNPQKSLNSQKSLELTQQKLFNLAIKCNYQTDNEIAVKYQNLFYHRSSHAKSGSGDESSCDYYDSIE